MRAPYSSRCPAGLSPAVNPRSDDMRTLIGLLALTLGVGFCHAEEETFPLEKLPKAVTDAVKAKYPKAEIKEAELQTENDKSIFELTIQIGEGTRELKLDADGKFLETSAIISVKLLPKVARDAIEAKFPKCKLRGEMEEGMKDGKTIYEVGVTTADGKFMEVNIDETGQFVADDD
jgi:uncharacterized membrane protein YkoI